MITFFITVGLGASFKLVKLGGQLLISIFVFFKLFGKNYDAAVMVAGFAGHGLDATPNAMANMSVVTQRYGPSKKAFLILSIVGAFLIDVFGIPIIITTINLFQ